MAVAVRKSVLGFPIISDTIAHLVYRVQTTGLVPSRGDVEAAPYTFENDVLDLLRVWFGTFCAVNARSRSQMIGFDAPLTMPSSVVLSICEEAKENSLAALVFV